MFWQKVRPGDRLWVRETWSGYIEKVAGSAEGCLWAAYRATDEDNFLPGMKWKSPIHMPRRFSRLTLVVTETRMQRVQEISYEGIVAEGVKGPFSQSTAAIPGPAARDAWEEKAEYAWEDTWISLHGQASWESNPEVVALTFEVRKSNIDALEAA